MDIHECAHCTAQPYCKSIVPMSESDDLCVDIPGELKQGQTVHKTAIDRTRCRQAERQTEKQKNKHIADI